MFNNLLADFEPNDYVYIVKTCQGFYATKEPLSLTESYCTICNRYDYVYVSGIVKSLRRFKNKENYLKSLEKNAKVLSKTRLVKGR